MEELLLPIFEKALSSVAGAWVAAASFVVILILLRYVEVSKIKLNPWSAIRQCVERFVTKKLSERVATLEKDMGDIKAMLAQHISNSDRRSADSARRRILAFEREIRNGGEHSDEEYLEIFQTIQRYETYCNAHSEYKNHVATCATELIKETYTNHLHKKKEAQS